MELLHVTPKCYVPSILQKGLLPRIGRNSTDAREKIPGIYLFRDWDAVENALLNWMGEQFEDIPLSVLRVRVSKAPLIHDPESFEYICQTSIPPEDIQELMTL